MFFREAVAILRENRISCSHLAGFRWHEHSAVTGACDAYRTFRCGFGSLFFHCDDKNGATALVKLSSQGVRGLSGFRPPNLQVELPSGLKFGAGDASEWTRSDFRAKLGFSCARENRLLGWREKRKHHKTECGSASVARSRGGGARPNNVR